MFLCQILWHILSGVCCGTHALMGYVAQGRSTQNYAGGLLFWQKERMKQRWSVRSIFENLKLRCIYLYSYILKYV